MTPVAIAVISYLGGALTVYMAYRLRGMSEDYEAASRAHSATIDGREACTGCGVPLRNDVAVLHHSQCPRIN